jgi:hypothetical protein
MSLLTTWGYTITDADALAAMLTDAEFNTMTANKYAGDVRMTDNIAAASMAIRNYCDWHIYPVQSCEYSEYLLYGNGRIKAIGCDYIIQLPASCVTAISEITIDGTPWTRFSLSTNGVVHLFDVGRIISRTTQVTVKYTAGLTDGLMAGLKELIAHRVTHALASSAGVQSETAGGVSITYSANWINSSRSTALADDNKEGLAPYKLRGVF